MKDSSISSWKIKIAVLLTESAKVSKASEPWEALKSIKFRLRTSSLVPTSCLSRWSSVRSTSHSWEAGAESLEAVTTLAKEHGENLARIYTSTTHIGSIEEEFCGAAVSSHIKMCVLPHILESWEASIAVKFHLPTVILLPFLGIRQHTVGFSDILELLGCLLLLNFTFSSIPIRMIFKCQGFISLFNFCFGCIFGDAQDSIVVFFLR